MYKYLLIFISITLSIPAFAQKKPTLMILPSDNWCNQRYFMTVYNDQGSNVKIPNYQQAFQEDIELSPVISKVGELMTKYGYSLKDAEMEIKNISIRSAEDNVTMSKETGSQLAESPLDILKQRAKADIIVQIGWVINRASNNTKSVTFTLEAFDAYTSKRLATCIGTSKSSNESIPILLHTAVESHIKAFDKQLDGYYNNMKSNGREVLLTVRVWENWDGDLESTYQGEELLNHIQNWLFVNTVKKQFNLSDASENFAQFEQVQIPLANKYGLALDARSFAAELQKHLQKEPFNITSKLMTRGLGEAIIVIGEK